ncbi:hypothetical protein NIIDMKKI_04480 [Mycobacterium kansasii]|uniref:Uncharacterized protein n=1 Tax=Mycobacterium kansasii TaxID=1768 RepID=A0A7G1I673_MYCKA|nr:hypothetical protein NIIDMKKI_04480 [Mycobacterium kansasii]
MTGVKALAYFQAGTIVAMVTGLLAINVCRLGEGVNADPGKTPPSTRCRSRSPEAITCGSC